MRVHQNSDLMGNAIFADEIIAKEVKSWITIALALNHKSKQWNDGVSKQFVDRHYDKFADEWCKRQGYSCKIGEREKPTWNEMLEDFKKWAEE